MKFHYRSAEMPPAISPVAQLEGRERTLLRFGWMAVPKYYENLDGFPLERAYAAPNEIVGDLNYSGLITLGIDCKVDTGEFLADMKVIEKMQRLLVACGSFHMLPG